MKTAWKARLPLELGLEGGQLAPKGVAPDAHVEETQVVASSMISPAQVRARGGRHNEVAKRLRQAPRASMPSVIVVDSPPGMIRPSSESRSAGTRDSASLSPELLEHLGVRLEVALDRQDADE